MQASAAAAATASSATTAASQIVLDGSLGEGGGQLLRTGITLSGLTGRSVAITRIRAKRPTPGLALQHLTSLQAAAKICGATLVGGFIGSCDVVFTPPLVRRITGGTYTFDIKTAGSTTLVLQTILPLLAVADGPSVVTLTGGTHAGMAPPFEFLRDSLLPLLAQVGIVAELSLSRYGFYPVGGGAITLRIAPRGAAACPPLVLPARGPLVSCSAVILHSQKVAPADVARGRAVIDAALTAGAGAGEASAAASAVAASAPPATVTAVKVDSTGPPVHAVLLTTVYTHVTDVVIAIGAKKGALVHTARELCVAMAAGDAPAATGVAVGEYLSDQLLLPLAICGGGSFTMGPPSSHFTTVVDVLRRFATRDDVVTCVRVGGAGEEGAGGMWEAVVLGGCLPLREAVGTADAPVVGPEFEPEPDSKRCRVMEGGGGGLT